MGWGSGCRSSDGSVCYGSFEEANGPGCGDRYMTEVRRIALPPGDVEPVLHGFRELEEILQG